MSHTLDLSLVVACYNEADYLIDSIREVVDTLDQTRYSYELIFIDDCSKDNSRELIDLLISQYPDKSFRKIFHEQNKGRGGTVTEGILNAHGHVVGYIDIDLETHARYIPSCVAAVKGGYDVVVARRYHHIQLPSLYRYILSTGYRLLVKWNFGFPTMDTEAGFKFFNRENILPVLSAVENQHWFWDTEIMIRSYLNGLKITEIPSLFIRRFNKHSTVNPITDSIEYLVQLYRFKKRIKQE
jgi:glycosyltransferase involved in cell wall biosynthesis